MCDFKKMLKIKCCLLNNFHFPICTNGINTKCPEFESESYANSFINHSFGSLNNEEKIKITLIIQLFFWTGDPANKNNNN